MAEERIPREVEDADVGALDISAQEAFIHSCIDGVLNIEDIADLTVLAPAQVVESIERLVSLAAVEWVAPKASSAPPQTELVEDVEIDGVLQEQIIEAFHRADKLNHYELLGVPIDADRSEIRKAYFALSKTFHPDAYFGKRLGSFKPKMEVVFRKVTDAYEAVGRSKKREAYDRYLKQSIAVSAAEQQIDRVEERAQAMAEASPKRPLPSAKRSPSWRPPRPRNGAPRKRRPKALPPSCRGPLSMTACSASASFSSGSFGGVPNRSRGGASRFARSPRLPRRSARRPPFGT